MLVNRQWDRVTSRLTFWMINGYVLNCDVSILGPLAAFRVWTLTDLARSRQSICDLSVRVKGLPGPGLVFLDALLQDSVLGIELMNLVFFVNGHGGQAIEASFTNAAKSIWQRQRLP